MTSDNIKKLFELLGIPEGSCPVTGKKNERRQSINRGRLTPASPLAHIRLTHTYQKDGDKHELNIHLPLLDETVFPSGKAVPCYDEVKHTLSIVDSLQCPDYDHLPVRKRKGESRPYPFIRIPEEMIPLITLPPKNTTVHCDESVFSIEPNLITILLPPELQNTAKIIENARSKDQTKE